MQPNQASRARVEPLLRVADRDMETAETLLKHSPHLYESIGFSCQQAVEKYAKAVLIARGRPAPFTHVLVKLPLVQDAIVTLDAAEMNAAAVLQDFAVEWRYETDNGPSYSSDQLVAMTRPFRPKLRPLAVLFLT